MVTPTTIAAYLVLFSAVACAFIVVNLTLGRLLRPEAPSPEKKEIYECGEPVIGSSFVRFDIRFYVVALLFIVFDVEVAFFFPWAVVFGKATQIAAAAESAQASPAAAESAASLVNAATQELGVAGSVTAAEGAALAGPAQTMIWTCVADIAVFFAVLMVGFAYVWSRGDLDWVRSTRNEPISATPEPPAAEAA